MKRLSKTQLMEKILLCSQGVCCGWDGVCCSVLMRSATSFLYTSRSAVGSLEIAVSASRARVWIQFFCLLSRLYLSPFCSSSVSEGFFTLFYDKECSDLVGKPEGKKLLGWCKHIYIYIYILEDNIKIYLKEIWWEDVPWIDLAQDRNKWWAVVSMIMNSGFHKLWLIA